MYSFYFRSCATTSPMRIAIIHSVPPAFSLNFLNYQFGQADIRNPLRYLLDSVKN